MRYSILVFLSFLLCAGSAAPYDTSGQMENGSHSIEIMIPDESGGPDDGSGPATGESPESVGEGNEAAAFPGPALQVESGDSPEQTPPTESGDSPEPAPLTESATSSGPAPVVESLGPVEPASTGDPLEPTEPASTGDPLEPTEPSPTGEPVDRPDLESPDPYPAPRAVAVPVGESLLSRNTIVSYYGHPNSRNMGILGEHSIEDLAARLRTTGGSYDTLNGDRGVITAFHLIFGTVWPGGDIGILNADRLRTYIEYAEAHGMLVFLDHQLGRFGVVESVKRMLPYLKYDSVHLAIDPEWHTDEPGIRLGHVTAAEINAAQEEIQRYMKENDIPGKKMLIVHQFNPTMIRDREQVHTDYPAVDLVHNADGFGNPNQKHGSYRHNRQAENIPYKGFKLFYPTTLRDWGWDKPLMTHEEVLALDPQPVLVMYQ